MSSANPSLTTPDLVVLSLLSEEPMHGYQVNQTLEYREVRDWAGISRPQVYYSLRKLERLELIAPEESREKLGPQRQTYATTPAGRKALSQALDLAHWTTQRPPPPFLTWLALSTHAAPATVARQVERRRRFLETEAERERLTLEAVRAEHGVMVVVAELMIGLTITQFEAELRWLGEVESRLVRSDKVRGERQQSEK